MRFRADAWGIGMILLLGTTLAGGAAGASAAETYSAAETASAADSVAVGSEKGASQAADSVAADSTKSAGKAGETRGKEKAKPKAKRKSKSAEGKVEGKAAQGTMPVKPDRAPEHIQVQHILIGFAGSVPGKNITRTREEAGALAHQILERARKGEKFDDLVRTYTDDSPPGIYAMSASGVKPAPGEFSRDGMVPAFGNVGFALSPGNIGIAEYDPATSPYGWHVIKRLK